MFPQQMVNYSLHFILLFLCFWLDPDNPERLLGEGERHDSFPTLELAILLGHDSFNEAFAKRLHQCIMALTFSGPTVLALK